MIICLRAPESEIYNEWLGTKHCYIQLITIYPIHTKTIGKIKLYVWQKYYVGSQLTRNPKDKSYFATEYLSRKLFSEHYNFTLRYICVLPRKTLLVLPLEAILCRAKKSFSHFIAMLELIIYVNWSLIWKSHSPFAEVGNNPGPI